MHSLVKLSCPTDGAAIQIALGVGWLVRAPGNMWLSWRCPCGQTHDLAREVPRQMVIALRASGITLANVAGVQEFMDPQRHGQPITPDDVHQVIDELYLDGEDHHLVSRFSEAFIESVQDELIHRRAASTALDRSKAALHRMRRPPA